MSTKRIALGIVVAGMLGSTAVALAAPSASAPPTIAGTPAYASELTCKPGSWSPDAVSFSYAWFVSDSQIATGQKFVPPAGYVNYVVHCRETATDASGATTAADSAPVQIGRGVTSLSLKGTKTTQKKKLVVTGTFGPKAALAKTTAARSGEVVVDEVSKDGLVQLFGKSSVDKNGKFKVTAPAPFGTHTYEVEFYPGDASLWSSQMKTIKVKLKKK